MKRACVGVLGCVSFIIACSQVANPTRPSPAAATQTVEWPALEGGHHYSTMGVVGADAPVSPTNLMTSVSGTSVTLAWAGSAGATSYIIEAGTAPGLTNITSFNTGNPTTTLTVPSVPVGTYYVRVRARNADGNSAPSNEVSFTIGGGPTCTSPPDAPTNVTNTLNEPLVTIRWDAPVGGCPAESYIIIAGTTDGSSNLADFDTGSTNTSFTANIGGVLDARDVFGRRIAAASIGEFYVQIAGRNRNGRGPKSTSTRVRRTTTPPPPPPTNCYNEWSVANQRCYDLYGALFGNRIHCYGDCTRAAEAWFQNRCQPTPFVPTGCTPRN